jgi:peptidyl-prolyl cis-trans isomerase SurA
MKTRETSSGKHRTATEAACLVLGLCLVVSASCQENDRGSQNESGTRVDRVVAVVNRQTILESDLEDEIQLSVLEPSVKGQENVTKLLALDRLIGRTLIQQQIRQEDLPAAEPNPNDIAARIEQIRTDLPACVRAGCKTDDGWKTFLAQHGLSEARVETYLHSRLEILSFIELRFRQGIQIAPEEIEQYYRQTLLPQYPAGQTPPPLEQVSSRIEEILLQQKVNILFDNWLANLRSQGQIEVLDPALDASKISPADGASKE